MREHVRNFTLPLDWKECFGDIEVLVGKLLLLFFVLLQTDGRGRGADRGQLRTCQDEASKYGSKGEAEERIMGESW